MRRFSTRLNHFLVLFIAEDIAFQDLRFQKRLLKKLAWFNIFRYPKNKTNLSLRLELRHGNLLRDYASACIYVKIEIRYENTIIKVRFMAAEYLVLNC